MQRANFICFNGEYIKDSDPSINYKNRGFLYGDGLFETLHAYNNNIHFLDDHYERLIKGMMLLKISPPDKFSRTIIKEKIIRLLNANKIFQGARIRISIFRDSEGFYTPNNNNAGYIIETNSISNNNYILNKKGLTIGLYQDIFKPINKLSNSKNTNSLIYVLAGIYKKTNDIDECIILNEKENICETISSNIFLSKGNKLYTPALSEGCIEGVMRKNIIKIGKQLKYGVFDTGSLKPEDLLLADEVFITNAIKGIQWVVAFKEKRYFKTTSEKLMEKLQDITS